MNNPCLGFQNTHLQTKRQDLAEAVQELGTAPLDGPNAWKWMKCDWRSWKLMEYSWGWQVFDDNIPWYFWWYMYIEDTNIIYGISWSIVRIQSIMMLTSVWFVADAYCWASRSGLSGCLNKGKPQDSLVNHDFPYSNYHLSPFIIIIIISIIIIIIIIIIYTYITILLEARCETRGLTWTSLELLRRHGAGGEGAALPW